jgi:hypothetical protein
MKAQDLEASIEGIFLRIPTLSGFSVHEYADALLVTEVSVYPSICLEPPDEVCNAIVATLAELIDEFPESRKLLSERTFARVFH